MADTITDSYQGIEIISDPEVEDAAIIPLLSRDEILAVTDRTYEYVNVPEWGGRVKVRSLDGRERARWQKGSLEIKGKTQTVNFDVSTVLLVALSVVDEKGSRLFADGDLRELSRKNSAALERVADVAMRLSGIGEDEIETIQGNSQGSQNGDLL